MEKREVITEFKRRFNILKAKGFVQSHRSKDTGIGKTFEDEMGVVENNSPDVDFMGLIELKTKREESESMLTLFTKAPNPKGTNTYLRKKYGTPDETFPDMKVFHTTISGDDYNTFNEGKYGFKLVCDDEAKKLRIEVRDNQTNTSMNEDIFYKYDTLRSCLEKKCAFIAFVNAETKRENKRDSFHFTSVKLLSLKSFDDFLQGIKDGAIKYYFRIGVYKSGKNMGHTHDHGAGFRIRRADIPKLFNVEEME